MRHLTPDQLLDLADRTQAEGEFPHLASCTICQGQLADLRSVLRAADDVQVPEPSPLFWDHLSARIRLAVAEETCPPSRRPAWTRRAWWGWAATAAALGALLLLIRPESPTVSAPGAPDTGAVASSDPAPSWSDVRAFDDDPALALLADLSAGLDWDAASEAGLVPAQGSVDRAVFALSAEERAELHRLLQEALAGAGA